MEIESLSCNNCGAPLEVPTSADFVTCGYCGSPLAVRRTPSAHYTELLERLEQHSDYLARRAEYLRLRDELEALDAEWRRERRRHAIRNWRGSLQTPTRSYLITNIIAAVVACALTAWWFYATATANAGPGAAFFGWIGAVVSLIAVIRAVGTANKVNTYNIARQAYQQQRIGLLNAINSVYPGTTPHPGASHLADREHQSYP